MLSAPAYLFVERRRLLEDLLGSNWFHTELYKKKNHPGYKQWKICTKMIRQNGSFRFPEDQTILFDNASLLLDGYIMAHCSGGTIGDRIGELSLGSFANYGDDKVRKKIWSRINEPSQFLDLMTELHHAAWHLLRGHKVIAFEENGFPDFQVEIRELNLPVVIDCKRINSTSSDNRFKSVIDKANNQIKKFNLTSNLSSYGLLVIDISSKIKIYKGLADLSDDIPDEVNRIAGIIQNSIQRFNSSISGVLILWAETYSLGDIIGSEKGGLISINERGLLIRHLSPVQELPLDFDLLNIGTFSAHFYITGVKPPSVAL